MARSAKTRAGARRAAPAKTRAAASRTAPGRKRSAAARRRTAARARRVRAALITATVSLVVLVFVGIAGVAVVVGGAVRGWDACPGIALGRVEASGWDDGQLDNAAVIMRAGSDLGLSVRDQAIGVMTAMGESSLRNLDYGDWETRGVTNPDGSRTTSIGLFQQQDGWGTRDQRMDPYTAATLFYRAMVRAVPDAERAGLDPTLVAHRTQINSDPEHYARYWASAVGVVEELSGADTGLDAGAAVGPDPGSAEQECEPRQS